MLSTRSRKLRYSIIPSSTINLFTRMLPILAVATIACCLFAIPAHASVTCGGSISCGTFTPTGTVSDCGAGWYYYTNGTTTTHMHCQKADSTGCSGTDPNGLTSTFGYLDPSKVNGTGITTTLGTIVMLGGGDGTAPESFQLTDAYFKAGYEVVQLAWDDAWEITQDPFKDIAPNIQAAACRPATFLNWVNNNLLAALNNKTPAMCALGDSAGSAAIAYTLAYYGGSNWLDNVELLSGPPLSDIEQGCGVGLGLGDNNPITVCDPTKGNMGYGCALGAGGSTWTLSPAYVGGSQIGVRNWTGQSSCAAGSNTSGSVNTAWLNESIVDQSTGQTGQGAVPTFSYSPTSMAGWVCRSVVNPSMSYNCATQGNANSNICPNNTSTQGQLFYSQIPSGTQNYALYAVDNCVTAEGVGAGNVPGYETGVFGGNATGVNAITYDMVGYGTIIGPKCVNRHSHH